jgi:uncharacterized protein (DUF1499 family)
VEIFSDGRPAAEMKKIVLLAVILVIAVLVGLFMLGKSSRDGQAPGLVDGRLARCADKPNCVCSEYRDQAQQYIEPQAIAAQDAEEVVSRLRRVIVEAGGSIRSERADYLAATFTSSWFGFVDDLEVRFDREASLLHFRSASRVGYSDLDVNRKRVEMLQRRFRDIVAGG